MSDYHLHLFPHRYPDRADDVAIPRGSYPIEHLERFVETAARRGVTELAFTEHLYRCVESTEVLGPFWEHEHAEVAELTKRDVEADRVLSLERYVDVVLRAKDRGLPVRLGLEVDFFPDTIAAVLEFLEPYPFDVLIGSVHWIGGWWFDRAHAFEEWERRGHRTVYEQYFALQAALAASGTVDVLAHIDRVKFLGHRLPEEPVDLYASVVDAAAETGVAVELSSAGLRHPVGEIYPSPSLLSMVHDAGLDITLASDGHGPDYAAWRFDELREIARAAGFSGSARFRDRNRFLEPLSGR